MYVCIPFVLWWAVNSGCESSLAWVALGSYQASERFRLIIMIFVTHNGDVAPQSHGTEITVRFGNVSAELKWENVNSERRPECSLVPRCLRAWLAISATDKYKILSSELL